MPPPPSDRPSATVSTCDVRLELICDIVKAMEVVYTFRAVPRCVFVVL